MDIVKFARRLRDLFAGIPQRSGIVMKGFVQQLGAVIKYYDYMDDFCFYEWVFGIMCAMAGAGLFGIFYGLIAFIVSGYAGIPWMIVAGILLFVTAVGMAALIKTWPKTIFSHMYGDFLRIIHDVDQEQLEKWLEEKKKEE